jgi:hypothetical protein
VRGIASFIIKNEAEHVAVPPPYWSGLPAGFDIAVSIDARDDVRVDRLGAFVEMVDNVHSIAFVLNLSQMIGGSDVVSLTGVQWFEAVG